MTQFEQVALVTGASRGIGKAIALQLAADGAYVVGTATSEAGALAITDYLQVAGLSGEGRELDVTATQSISQLLTAMEASCGMPNILVNNAGITRDNLFLRMDDDEWHSIIDTNLTAVYRMSKACIRHMFRKRHGRIINVSSVVGSTGNAGQANYAAAKSGLVGLTKSIAQEVASRGVTINLVSPGFIDTDMTRGLPEMVKEELLKRIPMKRLGQAEDIAHAVSYLSSSRANYVTGETIHINGGMYMA